jgi:outer membrane protein
MKLSAHMGWLGRLGFYGLVLILQPAAGHGADSGSGSTAQGAVMLPGAAPAGAGLTLEDVVRITLENQSSIKSAAYQTKAQDALLHQQMAAYYPTVNFNNFYRTNNTGGRFNGSGKAFDTVSSVANVNMTLYNFGKREGTVQSARDTLSASQYSYNATANNTVLTAKQAYYGILQANALVNVNEETVKNREALLRQSQSFYEVGTKPKSDVTQAEANLYLAQANLIVARNGVDVAWANLKTAIGVDDFSRQALAEELAITPFSTSLEQAKETAFAARPELLQFEALLKAQDQQIAVARRNHLPDLIFNSSYGRQGAHSEIFPLQTTWLVQLNFNIPIFNGFQTTYQLEQALATYGSIKEQQRVQKQQIAFQVEQNYLNLNAARDVVRANEAAVRAAKENLDLHEARYQVGFAPIVEVTDAQSTYTTAQTNYVNSLIAYKLSIAQLLNAIGSQ